MAGPTTPSSSCSTCRRHTLRIFAATLLTTLTLRDPIRYFKETGFAADSTYQVPYRPSSQLRLIHLTRMINVTAAQQTSYNQHNDPDSHPGLRPGDLSVAGDLGANNAFTPDTPNAGIDSVWGREAALLPNNTVLPKFRNCAFKRESVGTGAARGIRLAPVNSQFVRSQVLSREEWQIYHRTVGGFARTHTAHSRKLSDEKNSMLDLRSRALTLRLLTTAFGSCSLPSCRLRLKTPSPSSRPFMGSSM